MERTPHNPNHGGDNTPEVRSGVNSYGTDDPEQQAHIENARIEASRERRHNRAQLERLVDAGLNPDDAETVVEFDQAERDRRRSDELLPGQAPRIYVACEAAEEAGQLHGRWIDTTDDLTDIQTQVVAMLAASPVVGADRYVIREHRGFEGYGVEEHAPIATVAVIGRNIQRYGAPYAAYLSVIDTRDAEALDSFDDLHVGSFDSAEAWAQAVGEDLDWDLQLDRAVDPQLRPYVGIDYAKFADDARAKWDIVDGLDGKTHVFLR
ncbi:MAG: antirestriction protein ArdA [Amycolatopsis sp.]|uniref:antirestriction protein ArdA n=1 Tax=Amycolatopsis sp. TaxID=37632 RepID=UPI002618A93B|nr:antirestriction protein ArdA [Amycolatopsis sp.]MCU1685427.1 antirestriction protein ArdA [Amycolatopsis sp.]